MLKIPWFLADELPPNHGTPWHRDHRARRRPQRRATCAWRLNFRKPISWTRGGWGTHETLGMCACVWTYYIYMCVYLFIFIFICICVCAYLCVCMCLCIKIRWFASVHLWMGHPFGTRNFNIAMARWLMIYSWFTYYKRWFSIAMLKFPEGNHHVHSFSMICRYAHQKTNA